LFIVSKSSSDSSCLSLYPCSFNISSLKGAMADTTLGSVGGINFKGCFSILSPRFVEAL